MVQYVILPSQSSGVPYSILSSGSTKFSMFSASPYEFHLGPLVQIRKYFHFVSSDPLIYNLTRNHLITITHLLHFFFKRHKQRHFVTEWLFIFCSYINITPKDVSWRMIVASLLTFSVICFRLLDLFHWLSAEYRPDVSYF